MKQIFKVSLFGAVALAVMSLGGAFGLAAPVVPGPPSGNYAAWTLTPEDPIAQNHTGTIAFGVPGVPNATFAVTKSVDDGEDVELRTSTDVGEWFTNATPFGSVFGASGPSDTIQVLSTRIDTGSLSSVATTTYTFAAPVPAGVLGFAFGDIDLDSLVISGISGDGSPLTGAQLVGSVFNFCDVTTGAPDDCDGLSAPWPVPVWDPETRTISYPTDEDTDGAITWFRPTVSISSLTFTFEGSDSAGSPSYRTWFAALSGQVGGTVAVPTGATATPVTVELLDVGGAVLATATTDASGVYSFPPRAALAGYTVRLVTPAGYTVVGGSSKTADLSAGNVVVDFSLTAESVTPKFTG